MLAGLLLTSISTLTMRAALFQRKSRSGWLEELDGIREDALATPDGTVGEVVDAGDIWTDLRDGGEYSDPHEISSLYATDETPDLPSPRTAPAKPGRTRGRGKAKSQPEGDSAIAAAPLTSAEHLASPTIAEGRSPSRFRPSPLQPSPPRAGAGALVADLGGGAADPVGP
ncbi:MAG: hypothetical protein R2701_06865 [Acidimicrobiales bacterium]